MCVTRRISTFLRYRAFGVNAANDGVSLVFSPDGAVVYIATGGEAVQAFGSTFGNTDFAMWSAVVGDSNLCDIVVSPDGLSASQSRFSGISIALHIDIDRKLPVMEF